MCTVIFMRNIFKGFPIVIVANRDEFYSRPAQEPKLSTAESSYGRGSTRVYAPTDLQRGGTWIGVNTHGVCVALTNRKDITSIRGALSRGHLVTKALSEVSANDALSSTLGSQQDGYNGFHLLITDAYNSYLVSGSGTSSVDGAELKFRAEPIYDGLHIITNLGIGAASARTPAILSTWELEEIGKHPPLPNSLSQLLRLHAKPSPKQDPVTHRLTGTCIHPIEGDPDYGTRSSSVIRLGEASGRKFAEWEYWHRDREACEPTYCVRPQWDTCKRLPIDAR